MEFMRVLFRSALPFCELVGSQGDRQVAGLLVPFGLHLGPREIGEELGDAGVFLRRVAAEDTQAGAADDGVLRRAFELVPAGQGGDAEERKSGVAGKSREIREDTGGRGTS